jgi:hypothetical protein
VAWQDAVFVLRQSRPVVRRHIGTVLNIAGRDRQGHWLAVALKDMTEGIDIDSAAYKQNETVRLLACPNRAPYGRCRRARRPARGGAARSHPHCPDICIV